MSEEKFKFIPVRSTEATILALPQTNGRLYFATDTGKIYLDTSTQNKVLMGGSGTGNSGIYYANRAAQSSDPEDGVGIMFTLDDIDGTQLPSVDDLVLNNADGAFYRVVTVNKTAETFTANKLAVSGNGSGTGSTISKGDIVVTNLNTESSILNGSDYSFSIKATSPIEEETPLYPDTDQLMVTIAYYQGIGNRMSSTPYFSETKRLSHNVALEYNAGPNLRDSQDISIQFTVGAIGYTGNISDLFKHSGVVTKAVSCTSLSLEWLTSTFNNNTYFTNSGITVGVNASTASERIFDVYFDDLLVYSTLLASGTRPNNVVITANSSIYDYATRTATSETLGPENYSHGSHTIKAQLSLKNSSNQRGSSTELLTKEIGLYLEEKPLIWIGDLEKQYYEYDTIFVPYRVYDPSTTDDAHVYLYKNGADILDGGYVKVSNNATSWTNWEISNLVAGENTSYTLRVGTGDNKVERTLTFNIQEDPRGMCATPGATLSLSAKGRSNSQSNKKSLILNGKHAILNGFNWYNNGWVTNDNQTSLKISNGATVKLPIGPMVFGASNANAHSIELRLKLSNIQDYSTIVTSYARYSATELQEDKKTPTGNVWNDDIQSETNPSGSGMFQRFLDQRADGLTSYDAYLTKQLPLDKAANPDKYIPNYDELEFDRLYRDYNLENAIITYKADNANVSSDPSICFGPQDGFFSNGTDSVSVNFVEDQIITITITCGSGTTMTGDDNLMKIYVNGMLTSLARSTKSKNGSDNAVWTIGNADASNETYLEFTSNVCDIDLYSLRIYNKELSITDILHNYAYDNTNTLEWDLVEELYEIKNNKQQFSYNKMLAYNDSDDVKYGKKQTLMPYILFTTDDSNTETEGNLPWFKTESDATGVSHYEKVDMEFVNPALDMAYARGFLGEKAQTEGYTDTIKYVKESADSVFNANATYYNKDGVQQTVTAADYQPGTHYLKNVTLTAVQNYYLHHCPSWTSKDISLGVQGTSSEFYPRRNYKAKTKKAVPVYVEGTTTQATERHYLNNDTTSAIYYDEYITEDEYGMMPHKGPFADSYAAYEADTTGTVSGNNMKFFYYDNPTIGTNKFTLKIDFMESSGSYNMGLANMINSAYSHHPLTDYVSAGAFVVEDPTATVASENTKAYDASTTYYYYTHKGVCKPANGSDEKAMNITSAEDLAMTPVDLWLKNTLPEKKVKILLTDEIAAAKGVTNAKDFSEKVNEIADTPEAIAAVVGKWFIKVPGYKTTVIDSVESYRTTIQGFPTLAFHQTKSMKAAGEEPVFIGRYNLLLDKGADDAYGFKLDTALQGYAKNKTLKKIAECWEFQNNSRGFCSFRDPWNRKELSFDAPETVKINNPTGAYTTNGAPIVADAFEYRYHTNADEIDLLVHLNNSHNSNEARVLLNDAFGFDVGDTNTGLENGRAQFLKLCKNWEKAVAWVWSTATDAIIDIGDGVLEEVPSMGTYTINPNVGIAFEANKYYTKSIVDSEEVYTLATTYNNTETYYQASAADNNTITYSIIKVVAADDTANLYAKNKFYIATGINDTYVLSDADTMDQGETYYVLVDNTANLKAAWKLPIDPNTGTTKWASWDTEKRYAYDTKEYRLAKFKNELTSHFNFEYLITYFIITEVLEAYDSRGKNCMMASWGPQAAGGDYIWYPIFYDMDTQLGINNTGIPSFEYDIDATDEGTFSTNDSVLWNNLYALYRDAISAKYQQLKGTAVETFKGPNTNNVGKLNNPPFSSIDKIEKFYSCDPELYNTYSMQGERPLLALNLDEHYKYIAITDIDANKESHKIVGANNIATPPILTGYVSSNIGLPIWDNDPTNKFFYALQGSRSMSRQQFLTNRFNYIDSWLNVGNYARAGNNRIRSRVSANSSINTSDKWIEGTAKNGDNGLETNVSYYKTDGSKTHLFDGEYWITMTPARNMYVTVGTDAANFPSLKYSGTPVRFETADLENGVRKSGNYREQLYYIYGLDQMKSLGDLSKLYFQEFALEGKVSKLIDLKLGYDGLDEEGHEYKNSGVNDWSIPGSSESATGGMPLLKEMNLSNITFKNTSKVLDLTSCTKLKNFRCKGSNITGVTFAEGVALDTLYLSNTITSLSLTEANMLTDLIETYANPVLNDDGNLEAVKGLYIDGLTDINLNGTINTATAITMLNINGGNLGYNSYKLLQKFYKSCYNFNTERKINLTNVKWSPYVLVATDEERDTTGNTTYYVDNGHFGLEALEDYQNTHGAIDWTNYRNNGKLYVYDATIQTVDITDIDLLTNLYTRSAVFKGLAGGNTHPNISGIIYVNNDTAVDEGVIQETLQAYYPNLQLFFKTVNPGYAARFVLLQTKEDGTIKETIIGTDKLSRDTDKQFFTNPLTRATTESAFNNQVIDAIIANKDFLGWGTANDKEHLVETYDENWLAYAAGNTAIHNWNTLSFTPDVYDYTFYAVFDYHYYNIYFHGATETDVYTKPMRYNAVITAPGLNEYIPVKDDSLLDPEETYKFMGWSNKVNGTQLVDLSDYLAVQERHFYAVFTKSSVYENVLSADCFNFTYVSGALSDEDAAYVVNNSYIIEPKTGITLSGKITLPIWYAGNGSDLPPGPIAQLRNFNGSHNCANITRVFFEQENNGHTNQIRRFLASCFNYDTKLISVEIPEGLRMLGGNVFEGCSSLKTTEFVGSISTIAGGAFAACFASEENVNVTIGSDKLTVLGSPVLSYNSIKSFGTLTLGSPTNPITHAITFSGVVVKESGGKYFKKVVIYYRDIDGTTTIKDHLEQNINYFSAGSYELNPVA